MPSVLGSDAARVAARRGCAGGLHRARGEPAGRAHRGGRRLLPGCRCLLRADRPAAGSHRARPGREAAARRAAAQRRDRRPDSDAPGGRAGRDRRSIAKRLDGVDDVLAGLDLWEEQVTTPDIDRASIPPMPSAATSSKAASASRSVSARARPPSRCRSGTVTSSWCSRSRSGPDYSERVREEGEVLQQAPPPAHRRDSRDDGLRRPDGARARVRGRAHARPDARRRGASQPRVPRAFRRATCWTLRLSRAAGHLAPGHQAGQHRHRAASAKATELHLVLFDFSLSRTPVENSSGPARRVTSIRSCRCGAAPLRPARRALRGRGHAVRDGDRAAAERGETAAIPRSSIAR